MRDMIRTFLLAHRLYGRGEYEAVALRGGQFLLDAQMPAPQSGWAQTYNGAMEPIWGRKFEPPAIAAWETVGVIEALLDLHLHTGARPYLDSAGAGLAWLEASRLPEGDFARFYEMGSNRPLYMTRDYRLTYDGGDPPRHYTFRGTFEVAKVQDAHRAVVAQGRERYLAGLAGGAGVGQPTAGQMGESGQLRPAMVSDERAVAAIVENLDPKDRWLEDDVINSETLIRNYKTLARFIIASNPPALTPARTIAAIADPMGNGLHAEAFGLARPGEG